MAAAGAAFLASPDFSLSQLQVSDNAAYLGGALFVGADLSANVSLSELNFSNNFALLGRTPIQAGPGCAGRCAVNMTSLWVHPSPQHSSGT